MSGGLDRVSRETELRCFNSVAVFSWRRPPFRSWAESTMMRVVTEVELDYSDFLRRRHRPAHSRRTAEGWAAFLLPHLRPEMLVLDIGCGPGSITVGLTGRVIGLDLAPIPIEGVPVVGASGSALPFASSSFDGIYLNAVLQHVGDAGAVLREARRVAKPGAVIGIGDADWGTRVIHPHDSRMARGQQIQEAVRTSGNVRIGRELRGLLTGAGFDNVNIEVQSRAVASDAAVRHMSVFEGSWFQAPEAVAYVTHLGISDADEMEDIAAAWKKWSSHASACSTDVWFAATGWAGPE